jgi:regulator of replication initiation timing
MKTSFTVMMILAIALVLPACSKEAKSLKEELRVVKEENSFLKAENIALKKEVEELYRKIEDKDKSKALPAPQVQSAPAKTDQPKKDVKQAVPAKTPEKPAEKVKRPDAERPR